MIRRAIISLSAASVLSIVAALPLSGQAPVSDPVPDLVITAFNGGPVPPYTVPRTPWGDPDIQGVWSSDDANMPMARGGRGRGGAPAAPQGLYLDDEQWAARQKQVQAQVTGIASETGTFRGDIPRRAFRQTSYIVDPPDGRTPAFTPEAEKRRAPRDQGTFGNGPFEWTTDFTNYDRCITRGIVGSVMRVVYGNGNRIVQAPGLVAITYEMIHETRFLYTDGRPHISPAIRQYMGDTRARWQNDVLVAETTNLTDQTSIGPNGNGLRHSARMKHVEKIKRVADDILQYQITIDDPVTYARPFTLSIPLTPLVGGDLLPYDCHEGNEAVRNSLGAERAEDRALAEDLAKGIKRARRPVQDGLGVGGQPVGEAGPPVGGAGRGGGGN